MCKWFSLQFSFPRHNAVSGRARALLRVEIIDTNAEQVVVAHMVVEHMATVIKYIYICTYRVYHVH